MNIEDRLSVIEFEKRLDKKGVIRMIRGFLKKFEQWLENKVGGWLWKKILKPFLQLFEPYK